MASFNYNILLRSKIILYIERIIVLFAVQRSRAVPKNRNRFDGTSNVSITADTQTGSVSAGVTSPAGCDAAYDGQRRYVLRSSLPLHLHLQVFPSIIVVSISNLRMLIEVIRHVIKGKKVKTSIYIARFMHQAPLTRIRH